MEGDPGPHSGSASIPWLTFSGAPNESVSTFVQSVQRIALQRNMMFDDGWVAQYAATCFANDSLLWYSDLDEGTRNSWAELRRALLRQYLRPSAVAPASPYNPGLPQQAAAGPAPQAGPSCQRPRSLRRGRIEFFLPEYARTVGFLAYQPLSAPGTAINIRAVQDLAQAQLISIPTVPSSTPFHIRMEGPRVGAEHPYLGLALSGDASEPYRIPQALPPGLQPKRFRLAPSVYCTPTRGSRTEDYGRRRGSRTVDFGRRRGSRTELPGTPIATWIFRPCTESSTVPRHRRVAKTSNLEERASSAIWKYDGDTDQLSMVWIMDDDTEEELKVVAPNGATQVDALHIHRHRDWSIAPPSLGEQAVELHFIPEESN